MLSIERFEHFADLIRRTAPIATHGENVVDPRWGLTVTDLHGIIDMAGISADANHIIDGMKAEVADLRAQLDAALHTPSRETERITGEPIGLTGAQGSAATGDAAEGAAGAGDQTGASTHTPPASEAIGDGAAADASNGSAATAGDEQEAGQHTA